VPTKTKTKPKTETDSDTAFDLDAVPEKDRDQVEALIPSERVLEAYTGRFLPGGHSDFEYFDSALRLYHNILMEGPTGSGKTTAARAYAAYKQLPFVSIEFSGALDPGSTYGTTLVDHSTGLPLWKDGEITLAARYGGVIMLDEVNFAPARFTAGFHGMLDARQNLYITELGARVAKHEGCVVFAAYNPRYRGTNMLNEAFLNRFAYPLRWGYDAQVEETRIGAYSPTLLNTVRRLRAQDDVLTDIGTNAMEEFIHIANDLSIEAAIYLFLNRLQPDDRATCAQILEANETQIVAELTA
jgi:MoxR-like ATPase